MNGYCIEELGLGMQATHEQTVTEADIIAFAELTGDRNPVHLDEAYAAATPFKGRIAHGMLTAGFISTILGMKLPGPGAIYMSQSLKFLAPVRIGDQVIAKAEISAIDAVKKRVTLQCSCMVGDRQVVAGEAMVWVPSRGS